MNKAELPDKTGALPAWQLTIEEIVRELDTDLAAGLTDQEVNSRVQIYGSNTLAEKKERSWFAKLFDQFKDVMVLILIAASILSGIMGDWVEAGVILAIVVINAILGLVQEGRAEKALAALQKMSSPQARLIRNKRQLTAASAELVPGDLVILEAGDLVPADIRLVECQSLKVEEASLTGESVAVEKNAAVHYTEMVPLGDRQNMVYMGTAITYGRARGVVAAIGGNTEIGSIADRLQSINQEDTPLKRSLNQLGKWLGIICLVVSVIIFTQGLIQGGDIKVMFMTAISLAVAAIPEGLPAVVTIVLALGMKRMAGRHAIVKRLLAVETLGCVDTICTDKTGTLTQNEMTVTRLYTHSRMYSAEGYGYSTEGGISVLNADGQPVSQISLKNLLSDNAETDNREDADLSLESEDVHPDLRRLMEIAVLCNEAVLTSDDSGNESIIGDPTEGAMLVAAAKTGLLKERMTGKHPRLADWPFDSERKMMTSFNLLPSEHSSQTVLALTKGAPDIILARCSRIFSDGRIIELTEEIRQEINKVNHDMAVQALRVLAFAWKEQSDEIDAESLINGNGLLPVDQLQAEQDMVFTGLMGMIDPGRPEARDAIKLCRQAGIRPVMITGDYPDTAEAIARDLGMLNAGDEVMTGAALDKTDDDQFRLSVERTAVYARVSPDHKVRIVNALRRNGHIASMTGDGVNDAMALKSADIGVAMGITGTEVAKSTADMILADDNFATIVDAVREGRIIYSNIRKFVGFLLSCNVGEILIIALTTLILGPRNIPLLPIQLLWLNLITDSFPALALGQEAGEPDIMQQKPRNPTEPILNRSMIVVVVSQSIAIFASVFTAFMIGRQRGGTYSYTEATITMARTYAFATLILAELFRSFSARSERTPIWNLGLFGNKTLNKAFLFSLVMLLLVVYVPFLQPIFSTITLSVSDWLVIIPLALIPFLVAEVIKLARFKKV